MPDPGTGSLIRLFPTYQSDVPLKGTYLAHDLRSHGKNQPRPYFYANFISSIDGRIAIAGDDDPGLGVPLQTANPRDWRLFQELAVQADLVLSSGRYLRDYEHGNAQDLLQVYQEPDFADLKVWRLETGLPPYPALGVLSTSLDFTLPAALLESGRRIVIITTTSASADRKEQLRQGSVEILECGGERVEGTLMAAGMQQLGYRTVYSAAGPQVLHMMAEARILDRLYLTFAFRVLGGETFATIMEGGLLDPVLDLELRGLLLDQGTESSCGQLFAAYDCV